MSVEASRTSISGRRALKAWLLGTCRHLALAGLGCVAAEQSAFAQAGAAPAEQPVGAQTPDAAATIETEAAATAAPAEARDSREIVVTGSRIANAGFVAPTPLTVVTQEQIQLAANLNINNLQYDIPALIPGIFAQQAAGNPGQANFNLRGLGSIRTLFLLNGRRVMPTSYDGTTDGNILPLSLVKRVDVVTGGASAAYGSDAISGVVNVILDSKYQGLKGSVQYGFAEAGDNKEYNASLTWGTSFADDRAHLVVSGEFYKSSGSNEGVARRPWANKGYALIPNPLYVAGSNNGQPRQLTLPNVRFSSMTDGGVITAGPLKGTAFGVGGVPEGFVYGDYVGATFMVGGSGGSFAKYGSITPRLNRKSIYSHLEYDLTETVNVFGEIMYVDSSASSTITPNYDNGNLTIRIDNPFIPAATRALMVARGLTSFTMGRGEIELGLNDAHGRYKYFQGSTGLAGKFGDDWSWNASYVYSSNKYRYDALNNRNETKWRQAIDVVANPANGAPICRSTLNAANNGCVPINLFGPGSISEAGVAYVTGTSFNYYPQTAWDASANISGSPFALWAGDVSIALGAEYRTNKINGTADPLSITREWRINNVQPLVAKQNVREAYAEFAIPLLKDLPFVQLLDFDAAARLTKYSTSGKVWSWKLGLNYTINKDLRLRATRSRDIRAPTLNDLFQGAGSQIGQIIDRLDNTGATIAYGTGGNPDLDPEIGNTLTAGIVLTPSWLSGFRASVDYYKIDLSGAISSPGIQGIIDNCLLYGQTNLCPFITRSPTTNKITFILNTAYNASQIKTSGVDIEAAYSLPLSNFVSSWDGQLSLRAIVTYIDELKTTNVGRTTDVAGATTPKWRGTVRATYSTDKLDLSLLYRFVNATVYDNTFVDGVDIDDNRVGGRSYFNFNFNFKLLENIDLFGKINNIFDNDPPVRTNGIIEPQTNGSGFYDLVGRSYGVGLRFSL
jgi:outer membrane receptor protein involved in Fe transport